MWKLRDFFGENEREIMRRAALNAEIRRERGGDESVVENEYARARNRRSPGQPATGNEVPRSVTSKP